MTRIMKNRALGMAAKRLYKGVVRPTVLCGAKTWNMREADRRKVGVLEMRCQQGMLRVWRVC